MINSQIIEATTVKPFPKLMRDKVSGNVVLFLTKNQGTLLYKAIENYPFPLGTFGVEDPEWYEDFKGSITLSNEE